MKTPREIYEEHEAQWLAPYAQLSSKSLGRQYPEAPCSYRPCFYRDLGRIVHSTAFRLLEYKTQVFVNHEGDYYRTRLTHSLEVSQMSAGVARALRLNEDLAKTIALAHDLGHAPFGHPGEEALDKLMADEGGFEHNVQGYRVVTMIEERYPNFLGLNLCYEVLEGIIKHDTTYDKPKKIDGFKDVGNPTLEAQIVNATDEIAFMNHDLDDGLHWGMLSMDSLKEVPLWADTFYEVSGTMKDAPDRIKRHQTITGLIGKLIGDLVSESKKRIEKACFKNLQDVRDRGAGTISFSEGIRSKTREVKDFLFKNMYHHEKIVKQAQNAGQIITDLFNHYLDDPKKLPEKYYNRYVKDGSRRHICDYIAGMTDRFAISQHKNLQK